MNKSQIILKMAQIHERADREGRELTQGERQTMEGLLEAVPHAEALEKSLGPVVPYVQPDQLAMLGGYWAGSDYPQSPGEAFTSSEGYKSIRNSESRAQTWSSGLIEVGLSTKGTLLEGVGSPGSGSGGGLVPLPQVVPGFVDKLFQPLVLENLLLSGVATGNTVRYALQGTATSGAAGVAEGGTKPESTLGTPRPTNP